MPEIEETPEQQRVDWEPDDCPVCGAKWEWRIKHNKGCVVSHFRYFSEGLCLRGTQKKTQWINFCRLLTANAAQQRVEELEKGIRELLPSFNDRFWDMCSYAEHLSELKSKLTSLLEGK